MSRRSKATISETKFRNLQVVCTRRGTHSAKRIGKVVVHESLDFDRNPASYDFLVESHFNEERINEALATRSPAFDSWKTYPLVCSKCGFNVPVRADRLDQVVRTLAKNDLWRLDISYLPDMLSNQ